MAGIWRWCGWRAGVPTGSSCRSSSIRRSSPRTRTSRTYPRTMAADLAALAPAGVDLVWAPARRRCIRRDLPPRIAPAGPAEAGLEDAFRPHFFAGVATVVAKLLIQVQPDVAVFGEKDYQQLQVVTRLARISTCRSNRRRADDPRKGRPRAVVAQRLSVGAGARRGADAASRARGHGASGSRRGANVARALDEAAPRSRAAGFALDYLEARHAETLAPVADRQGRPDPASGGGAARHDAADRQHQGVSAAILAG